MKDRFEEPFKPFDCDDCVSLFRVSMAFGVSPVPCNACTADGVVVTKGVM